MLAKSTTLCKMLTRGCAYSDQAVIALPVLPKPIWTNPVSPFAWGVRTCTHSQPRITPLAQESAASKIPNAAIFGCQQPTTNTSCRSSVITEKSKNHAGTRQLQQITRNTHTHTHTHIRTTHHEMGGPMHTPDQQPRRLVKEEQSRRSAHCSQFGMALMCS